MSFDLGSIETTLDNVVSEADNFADLADKAADAVSGLLSDIPVVGTEATSVINALNTFTKALDDLKAALATI